MKSSVSREICEKIKPEINNPSSNNFPLVYKKCLYYYAPNVTKTVGPIWRKKINSICTSTSPKLSYNLIKTSNNFLLRRHKFLLHFADMASYSVFLTYRPDSKLNKQSRDLMHANIVSLRFMRRRILDYTINLHAYKICTLALSPFEYKESSFQGTTRNVTGFGVI